MRLAAAVVAAWPLLAQTPSIVHILADDAQVLVGRTLRLRAVVRDANGNAIPNAAVTWSVNRPGDASVGSDGVFAARGLATVQVTARASNGASGVAAIQTVPSRVEVSPRTASVEVGTTQRFTVAAYDADGSVIAGPTFTWSLLNQRQGGSSLGRIDAGGMMTATGEGGAWVFATYTYNEVQPGLQRQWVAYAPVTINVPKSYELRKVFSSLGQQRDRWTLRPRQSMIWHTDSGELLFNASLDGLANGLLAWKDGQFRVVTGGGVPRFGRAATALDFRQHAISRGGSMLTYEDTNINGAEINKGTPDGVAPFLNNNVPLGDTEATSGLFITRNSHTSSGWSAVRGNFRFENNTTTYSGLFRGSRTISEMLVNTRDGLPDLTGTIAIDADFGIADNGTVVFSATAGANRNFYKYDFSGRQKLIGVGDSILGSRVRSFVGGRTNVPSFWVDEDGTVILTVLLEDGTTHMLQFSPSSSMTSLRVNSQVGVLFRHPSHGTLIYANPFNNQGNGAYLWSEQGLKQILVLGRTLFEQAIQEIESGVVDRNGDITLMLRGAGNPLMVARMTPEPHVLFGAGDPVRATLPVNAFTFIGGAREGPPHVQAGGNAGSIAEFDGRDFKATLAIGERLFGDTMWFGGSHGNLYNMRKAPNGDIYFITGTRIARIAAGTGFPQIALQFPITVNGISVNAPSQLDVNAAGTILFSSSTGAGDNRFFLHENGNTRQLLVHSTTAATATTFGTRIVNSFDSFALDNRGRVLAQIRFRGVALPVLIAWNGTEWRIAAEPGVTRVGEHTVANLPTVVRGMGNRLFAGLTIGTGGAVLAEWNDGWTVAVNNSTVMPNGQVANNALTMDLNNFGHVLFQFNNGVTSLAVQRGDKLHQVHNFFRPTPQGDYLLRINSMDFRDDGTVYFLGVTEEDEVVMYEGRPLF
jgi:hypothetical protein